MGSSHEVNQTVSITKAELIAVLLSTILSALCRACHISRPLINIVLNELVQGPILSVSGWNGVHLFASEGAALVAL